MVLQKLLFKSFQTVLFLTLSALLVDGAFINAGQAMDIDMDKKSLFLGKDNSPSKRSRGLKELPSPFIPEENSKSEPDSTETTRPKEKTSFEDYLQMAVLETTHQPTYPQLSFTLREIDTRTTTTTNRSVNSAKNNRSKAKGSKAQRIPLPKSAKSMDQMDVVSYFIGSRNKNSASNITPPPYTPQGGEIEDEEVPSTTTTTSNPMPTIATAAATTITSYIAAAPNQLWAIPISALHPSEADKNMQHTSPHIPPSFRSLDLSVPTQGQSSLRTVPDYPAIPQIAHPSFGLPSSSFFPYGVAKNQEFYNSNNIPSSGPPPLHAFHNIQTAIPPSTNTQFIPTSNVQPISSVQTQIPTATSQKFYCNMNEEEKKAILTKYYKDEEKSLKWIKGQLGIGYQMLTKELDKFGLKSLPTSFSLANSKIQRLIKLKAAGFTLEKIASQIGWTYQEAVYKWDLLHRKSTYHIYGPALDNAQIATIEQLDEANTPLANILAQFPKQNHARVQHYVEVLQELKQHPVIEEAGGL